MTENMPRPLTSLRASECRWPVNHAARGEVHLFCGALAVEGKPYCRHHLGVAYRKLEARPKR